MPIDSGARSALAARGQPVALRAEALARTFRGSFRSNLTNQFRWYTFGGWMIASLFRPVFMLASAAVIAHFIAGGGVPPRFFALTGYPSYLAFVLLGMSANGLMLSSLDDGGTAIYDEENAGTWDLLALTPMNRFVWMFAKTLSGMVASLIDFALVLVVGALLFGLSFTPGGFAVAFVGLVLTLVALQGMAFLMAAAGLFWKQPYALSMMFAPLLIFLSGMMFPVEALPGWVQPLSQALPLTHGLRILREAMLRGTGLGALLPSFGMLLATGAVFMLVGYVAFTTLERRARAKGAMGRY
ncbi:MAG: ABC transporter permease [Halobacteriales archaeon]|nr:ABC transporter permease [Halobacteriales archaeon]